MDTHEETSAFRSINIRDQLKSNVCVLVKLSETKLRKKAKLCYMDTDSFLVYTKIEDIDIDISKNVKQDLIFQIMN